MSGTARWTTSWTSCCRSWWPEWRGSAICSGDGGCDNHDVVIRLTIGAHVNCHQGVPPRQPDHLPVSLHLLLKMLGCLLWSQHFCSFGVGKPLILCLVQKIPCNRICVSHISKNMGYCLSKKRICHMGHHGIKILCGFSFYSTEYFRGVVGCAFWLMRLLAFNLWYIVSVCTKWIEHIYWILLWSPHELCRAARTITQLSIHGVRLQQREPKTQSIFSFCHFTPADRQSSH